MDSMDTMLRLKAEQVAAEMAEQVRTPAEVQSLMRLMMKTVMERVLDVEFDHHLGRRKAVATEAPVSPATADAALPDTAVPARKRRNRRNGRTPKTVRANLGEITIETPRDRNGTFEPLLVPKYQRQVSGLRGEDHRVVRQGDEHARHPRDSPGPVRGGGLGDADFRRHSGHRRGGHGLAFATAAVDL